MFINGAPAVESRWQIRQLFVDRWTNVSIVELASVFVPWLSNVLPDGILSFAVQVAPIIR